MFIFIEASSLYCLFHNFERKSFYNTFKPIDSLYCIYFMYKYHLNIFVHITHSHKHYTLYKNYIFDRAQYISVNFLTSQCS